MNKLKTPILLLFLIMSVSVMAQRQRNYVYLFDCTWSMKSPNGIWEQAKQFMKDDIDQLDENANVTIVLFHQNTANPICFKAKDFVWKNVETQCENMINASQRTGICNAWDLGLKYIDKNRNNYLYLFTDGTENVHQRKTDAVCERIRKWCQQAPNNYAFFVALGKEIKEKPDVKKLIAATEACDRAFYIEDHQGPFGAFDKTSFKLNSHSTKNLQSGFSDYGSFNASVECNDDFYRVSLKDNKIEDGKAIFLIEQKIQPTSNHQVHLKIKSNEKELHICNPNLYINIDTRDLANLDLGQPSGEAEGQYNAGEAETYSRFLFWKGKEVEVIQTNLGAVYNDQAKKRNCSLIVSLNIPSELKNKCKLHYNGEIIGTSFEIKASDTNSIITIEVPHSIAQKEYVIGMKGKAKGLETINAEENLSYVSSIYFEHDVCWHPMKVLFMWFGILTLALLILWFFFLRPIVYPRFGSIQKTFIIPGMAPLIIKFKGARMVVLAASHPKKQSAWNRFWTGKILYKTHPAFVTPIVLKPSRDRRVLFKVQAGSYQVMPNPMPGVGAATIIDIKKNLKINVN